MGDCMARQVRLMSLPLFMNNSALPNILARETAKIKSLINWLEFSGRIGNVFSCVFSVSVLTHNIQSKALTYFWLCGHLALVGTRISGLGGGYSQGPFVGALTVQGLKSLIVGVCQNANG